jgi:hypothetical protein
LILTHTFFEITSEHLGFQHTWTTSRDSLAAVKKRDFIKYPYTFDALTRTIIKDVPQVFGAPVNFKRLFLKKDALVWILEDGGHTNPNNPNDVVVLIRNVHQADNLEPLAEGVVPFNCLEIGSYEGEYSSRIISSFDQDVPINAQAGSLLQRTLEALFRAMAMDNGRLQEVGYSQSHLARLRNEPDKVAERIIKCEYWSN